MRSSFVPLAAAGLIALALTEAPPARAAGGCCTLAAVSRTEVFGEAHLTERLAPDAAVRPAPAPEAVERPAPTPLDHSAERLVVGQAYKDVFRVLKDDNDCSRFFGGPRAAVTVLNEFARQLRRKPLGQYDIAMRMSGSYTTYHNQQTGASYRLFDEALINSNGAFAAVAPPSWGKRLQIGRFTAETREAKALMLLHELGHLIAVPGGWWLLPNDGGDSALSERNTRTVESRCLRQLLSLRD